MDRRKDIDVNTAQWKVLLQQLKHEPIIRKMTEEEGEMLFDEYLVELRRKQKVSESFLGEWKVF